MGHFKEQEIDQNPQTRGANANYAAQDLRRDFESVLETTPFIWDFESEVNEGYQLAFPLALGDPVGHPIFA